MKHAPILASALLAGLLTAAIAVAGPFRDESAPPAGLPSSGGTLTGDLTVNADIIIQNGNDIDWATWGTFTSSADGKFVMTDDAQTTGVTLDASAADTLTVRNKADSADGALACGAFTASAASTMTSATMSGNLTSCDSSITVCAETTDAAPYGMVMTGGDAWAGSSSNTTGADITIAAGEGTTQSDVVDYTQCGTDVITITIDGSDTALTEASEWTAATDNATTCTSLCGAIDALSGVTAACTSAECRITKDLGTVDVEVATSDATCATVTNGTEGDVILNHDVVINGILDIQPRSGFHEIYVNRAENTWIRGASDRITLYGGNSLVIEGRNGAVAMNVGVMWLNCNFGSNCDGTDAQLRIDTSKDQFSFGVPSEGGTQLIIAPSQYAHLEYSHAEVAGRPVVYVQSETSPASATDEWISFSHDTNNGVIAVGSGVVSFPGDVAVTGGLAGGYHGEMYQRDNASATTVTVQNTWYEVDNYTSGLLDGMTHATGDITVTNAGNYQVHASIVASGGGNDELEFAISIDDTIQDKCITRRKLGAGGDVGSAVISCLLAVSAAEVIKLEARNTSGTTDITVLHSNVFVHQI